MGRSVPITSLTTREPFADIFPVDPETVEAIRTHMRVEGYDEGAPIIVWPEGGRLTVIDGHTRLQAAVGVPLTDVYIHDHEFADEDAALTYAVHNQRDRRNLSSEDLLRVIARVDAHFRKPLGTNRFTSGVGGSTEPPTSRPSQPMISAEQTAKLVGTSPSTVKRARAILADPVATEAVQTGMPIARAAEAAYARKRGEAVSFPPVSTNGATMPSHDDEPWFKAKAAGSIAASTLRIAIREVRQLIEQLERDEIAIADLMGDRRVSGAWSGTADNGALRRANELAGLIRDAIRG